MLKDYMGVISLSEDESNIRSLTVHRPIASIPIFARYRVIDFMLSNMKNAGITNVGIFVNSASRSLIDHIGTGKPWDMNRKNDGVFIFNRYLNAAVNSDIKLLKNNLEFLYRSKKNKVIMTSSYMICNIDFEEIAYEHEKSDADVTVVYKKVENGDNMFLNCDTLKIDENGRVLSVGRNLCLTDTANVSMEIYIMNKEFFIDCILRCIQDGGCDTIKQYIFANLKKFDVRAYEYKGYVGCINSVNSYYRVSMDILEYDVMNELLNSSRRIYTKSNDSPPTKYLNGSEIVNSLIANGCIIKGTVKNSIISRGVVIEEGAEVINSIVFPKCVINSNVKLKNVILDKNVEIEMDKVLIGDKNYPVVIEKGSYVGI
ncbi:MAG: glucose-1-phosphate adenylyltransferase subunit GlgD [Caloramator sp.]|nr:glucose-1-phosphate adenylyltransferase subunit GlgD [Caloramator sp.]